MFVMFRRNEVIDRQWLESLLKGEYAKKCLDKVERMDGVLNAIVFFPGDGTHEPSETLYYSRGANGFNTLRTNDSFQSFCAHGDRFVFEEKRDRLVEKVFEQEASIAEHLENLAKQISTNLVGASAG